MPFRITVVPVYPSGPAERPQRQIVGALHCQQYMYRENVAGTWQQAIIFHL